MSETQKIKAFWDWFQKNHQQYLFVNQVDAQEKDRLLGEFVQQLHQYHEHLFPLIGGHPDAKKTELIISAEGIKEYFPAVEQLVAAAPEMQDWEFIAFKPPMGHGFSIEYGGKEFDPEKIIFIPLKNDQYPNSIGIHICYPDYQDAERNIFVGGTYLILDTILGERSTTLDIDYLDVVKTPADASKYGYRPLSKLKEYIDQKKSRK
jgi:hypothetical protein